MSVNWGPRVKRLLVAALGGPPEELFASDAERALERASELAVFPLVAGRLQDAGLDLPPFAARMWRDHVARLALIRHVLAQAHDALSHIDHLILKGEPLAHILFGDGRAREVIDIDILVQPQDIEACIEALATVGLQPLPGAQPEPWVNNEFPLFHETLAVMVEIHWGLALPRVPTPDADRVIAQRIAHRLDQDLLLEVPSPEHTLLAACYHHHHHVGFFKGLLDIAACLDRWDGALLDWAAIEREAQCLAVEGILHWPLEAIAKLTRIPSPLQMPRSMVLPKMWASASARAVRGCLARPTPYGGLELVAPKVGEVSLAAVMLWGTASMSLLDGVGARTQGVLTPVFVGPERLAQAHGQERPNAGTWLRVAARPLTLVRRQLGEWKDRL